jgi:hypothetical protein
MLAGVAPAIQGDPGWPAVRVYDLRTNKNFTLKTKRMTRLQKPRRTRKICAGAGQEHGSRCTS